MEGVLNLFLDAGSANKGSFQLKGGQRGSAPSSQCPGARDTGKSIKKVKLSLSSTFSALKTPACFLCSSQILALKAMSTQKLQSAMAHTGP